MDMDFQDAIKAQLMDAQDLNRTLNRMARQIIEVIDFQTDPSTQLALIGMQTRGVYLAQRLQQKIAQIENVTLPLGILDTTMYRDDFRSRLRQPTIQATDIPFDIYNRHLVLVDDVLYTGRTTRAAMDALMDMGRPASIRFLVIVDRGLRELPVRADMVGLTVPTTTDEEVRVRVKELDGIEGVWLVKAPDVKND